MENSPLLKALKEYFNKEDSSLAEPPSASQFGAIVVEALGSEANAG